MKRKKLFASVLILAALVLWALLSSLVGQPLSAPTQAAPAWAAEQMVLPFDPRDVVQQDLNSYRTVDGGLQADNGRVRADLSSWGFTFGLYDQGHVLPGARLGYRLSQVFRGDTMIYTAPPQGGDAPAVQDSPLQAGFARAGGIVEAYRVLDYQVEQFFVIPRAPAGSGDLVLVGILSTTLRPAETGLLSSGVAHFPLGNGNELTYGPATVKDAAGRESPVSMRIDGSEVRLVVPGNWLSAAMYPVVVDPLYGSELRITTSDATQSDPAVAANSKNDNMPGDDDYRYLVAWADNRNSGTTGWDIYAQVVKANGTAYSGNAQVVSLSGNQTSPAIACDTTSTPYCLLVYLNGSTVKGQLLNLDGTTYGNEIPISNHTGAGRPTVAFASSAGIYLVTWADNSSGNWDLYSRVVNLNGGLPGSETLVTTQAGDQDRPSAVWDGKRSHFFVTWENSATIYGVACSISSNNCSSSGHSIVTISSSPGWDGNASVALNSFSNPDGYNGEAFVVWERATSPTSIWSQRLYWNGSNYAVVSGGNVRLSPIAGINATYSSPRVAYQPGTNEYLVTWRVGTGGIEAQQVSARGDPEALLAVSGLSNDSMNRTVPAVVLNPLLNQYLLTWQGQAWCSDLGCKQDEIYSRRMDFSTLSGSTTDVEAYVAVAHDSDLDHYLVVWTRYNIAVAQNHIYGQLFSADGHSLGNPFVICGNSAGRCNNNRDRWGTVAAYDSQYHRYLIAWCDSYLYDENIRAVEVEADGTVPRNPINIIGGNDGAGEDNPSIAYDSAGGQFLVVWQDGATGIEIRGNIVQLQADPTPPATRVPVTQLPQDVLISESGAGSTNYRAGVAANPGDTTRRFLVIWTKDRTGTWKAFVSADGSSITDRGSISIYSDPFFGPNVQFGGSRYLVTYGGDSGQVWGALLNTSGSSVWSDCNLANATRHGDNPRNEAGIGADSNNFQVLFWGWNGSQWEIRGSEVNQGSSSCPTPNDVPVFLSAPEPYDGPAIACNSGYNCMVAHGVIAPTPTPGGPTPTPGTNYDVYGSMIFR